MASILILHDSPFDYPGVMALAAYIKSKGHRIDVLIKREEKKFFWEKAKDFQPDWVGFSSIFSLQHRDFALAREAKERLGAGTIFGGPFATHYSGCIEREEIDVLIRGEGEEPLKQFLDAYDKGEDYTQIPGVWSKKEGKIIRNPPGKIETDLNKYPIPDRSIYYKYAYLRDNPDKQFMSGRGCPFSCYFCFNVNLNEMYNLKGKNKVRRRSPELMVEEVAQCKRNYLLDHVTFNDDIFTFNVEWLEKFAPLYWKEVGNRFCCQAHVNTMSEEIAKLLKEAGCTMVMIGLESGSPRVRTEILGKHFSNERFYQTADIVHKYGMKVKTYNFVGSPTETLEEAVSTMEANAIGKVEFAWCALYQPQPGTMTFKIGQEKGCIRDEFTAINFVGSVYTKSQLVQPEIEKIERLQKLFYYGIRHKWLIPTIKKLAHIKLYNIYVILFLISTFIRIKEESKLSWWMMVKITLRNLRHY